MTLDAGGTNFVFSAMQANRPVVTSFALPANADHLERSLANIVTGFERVRGELPAPHGAVEGRTGLDGQLVGRDVLRAQVQGLVQLPRPVGHALAGSSAPNRLASCSVAICASKIRSARFSLVTLSNWAAS